MDKVRLGLIGCGGNMRAHIRKFASFPDVEIVAAADPVADNFVQAKALFPDPDQVKQYADHRDLVAAGSIDAVVISTPHTLHFEQVRDALEAGLHVMVEKPMVCTSAHAEELIRLRDKTGKHLLVGYQRHYEPAYRYVRDRFASGEWPSPHFLTVWQSQNWLIGTMGKWRQEPSLSGGGQLNDSGSHLVDVLLWMTGLKPVEAFAYIDNRGSKVDILTAASIRFEGGAVGNLSVIGDSRTDGMQEGLYMWHEKGMAEIYGTGGRRLVLRMPDERVVDPAELPEASSPDRNFIDAVLGKAEVQSTAEAALGVIRLTEALWESAGKGAPVSVPR